MLEYQSTSYHDVATTRELLGLRPAPEFELWLQQQGIPQPRWDSAGRWRGSSLMELTR